MTLDEAIKYAEGIVEEKLYNYQECLDMNDTEGAMGCMKCGEEYKQIAEWLKEFKRLKEQESCEDSISRKALLERINNAEEDFKHDNIDSISSDVEDPFVDGVLSGVFNIKLMVLQAPSVKTTQKWIPIISREPTQGEKDDYFANNGEELCFMVDSEMPIDMQEVLVSSGGYVAEDVFNEDYFDFENNDLVNVDAWMPLPEPYRESEDKE